MLHRGRGSLLLLSFTLLLILLFLAHAPASGSCPLYSVPVAPDGHRVCCVRDVRDKLPQGLCLLPMGCRNPLGARLPGLGCTASLGKWANGKEREGSAGRQSRREAAQPEPLSIVAHSASPMCARLATSAEEPGTLLVAFCGQLGLIPPSLSLRARVSCARFVGVARGVVPLPGSSLAALATLAAGGWPSVLGRSCLPWRRTSSGKRSGA